MLRYPLILLLALSALALSQQNCSPFGLRLNYGRSISDPNSQQRLALRFNTRSECPEIELLINKYMIVHCPIRETAHKMADYRITEVLYTSFVHVCSLTRQLEFDVETEYNLYDIQRSRKIFPQNKKIKIKDPHRRDQEFRFLHVADWGPITLPIKKERFESITGSMVEMIRQGKADCLIINGDIGYELNSNVQFHQLVMKMIEEVGSLVPIIVNRGNHEENGFNNTVGTMFQDYFQLYGLEKGNATGITIGPVFFAIIDPLNLLIPRRYPSFTEESRYSSLQAIKPHLSQASAQGKTIVLLSHYPLICGYPSPNHCFPNAKFNQFVPLYANLMDFYRLALKHRIPLVLSGHMHEYERTYPLISGYRSKSREANRYVFDDEWFIQVVEGVAGSNDGLQSPNEGDSWSAFVASHHERDTGFGLFTASGKELEYEHYRLPKGRTAQLFDQFIIQLPNQKKAAQQL